MTVALIVCGALGREVQHIVRNHGWNCAIYGVSASYHQTPQYIATEVEARLQILKDSYEQVLVVYGDCGTYGALDRVLDRYDVQRIKGDHCYALYAGELFEQLLADEPGTYILTDYMVRKFDSLIARSMGLDRYPELKADYFRHYKRIVYLAQNPTPELTHQAKQIATNLGLELEIQVTGYGQLERQLIDYFSTVLTESEPCST